MTGNESFDHTLETWLRRQAPQQAPDRVLDAALERVELEPQRRGWLQRVFGGTAMTNITRIAAVTTAVVVAAVIGLQLINLTTDVGPSPVPSPSAEPSESAAPSSSAASAEPSTEPSAAALVARLLGGGESGGFHLVTVLDDGRVITSDPSGVNAPMERRLTAAGIQLVRDEMAATGLTDTSADYSPVENPGVEAPGFGGGGPRLEVVQPGGSTVVITWYLFADTEEDYFQPQPEAEALEELMIRLSTLQEWLPAAAWADANATPYVPDGYRMTISSSPWGGSAGELPADVSTVTWPPGADMASLDEVLDSERDEIRCGPLDAAEGTALIAALQAAGARPQDETYLSFELGEPETSRLITITLAPILPFDDSVC
jgi:hypothetical protein